jgi:hypothetical protein
MTSQIVDDGFRHSLIVYEDLQTRGLRLHAAVWEGELRQCPVWTAFGKYPSPPQDPRLAATLFWTLPGDYPLSLLTANAVRNPVTRQSQSPTWISQRSRHRVWLKDVQLYAFCNTYRQESMRQNKVGAFEIKFDKEEGTPAAPRPEYAYVFGTVDSDTKTRGPQRPTGSRSCSRPRQPLRRPRRTNPGPAPPRRPPLWAVDDH